MSRPTTPYGNLSLRLSWHSWQASGALHALAVGALAASGTLAPRLYPPRQGENSLASVASEVVMVEEATPEAEDFPVVDIAPEALETPPASPSSVHAELDKVSPSTMPSVLASSPAMAEFVITELVAAEETTQRRESIENPPGVPEAETFTAPRNSADSPPNTSTLASLPSAANDGQLAEIPSVLHNPPPVYPPEALAAEWEGRVVLRVAVDASGRVTAATVLQSSGHAILDEAARRTVLERWRFEPARRFGFPIATEIRVPLNFQIQRD